MNDEYKSLRGKPIISLIRRGEINSFSYKEKRMYLGFSCTGIYVVEKEQLTNAVVAYAPGCNLNCYYCFSYTKDFVNRNPFAYMPPQLYPTIEKNAGFYSPEEVFESLMKVRDAKDTSGFGFFETTGKLNPAKDINWVTIRCCEPTLNRKHFLGLLKLCAANELKFLLDTNGICFGKDETYIEEVAEYKDYINVFVSIKAGTEEKFTEFTGAKGDWLKYQYKCVEGLVKRDFKLGIVAMYGPNFGNEDQKDIVMKRLFDSGFTKEKHGLIEQDYIAHFVPEYKKNGKWEIAKQPKVQN